MLRETTCQNVKTNFQLNSRISWSRCVAFEPDDLHFSTWAPSWNYSPWIMVFSSHHRNTQVIFHSTCTEQGSHTNRHMVKRRRLDQLFGQALLLILLSSFSSHLHIDLASCCWICCSSSCILLRMEGSLYVGKYAASQHGKEKNHHLRSRWDLLAAWRLLSNRTMFEKWLDQGHRPQGPRSPCPRPPVHHLWATYVHLAKCWQTAKWTANGLQCNWVYAACALPDITKYHGR